VKTYNSSFSASPMAPAVSDLLTAPNDRCITIPSP
jgi:hypothetical protein